jgi:ribonuclease HI
MLAPLDGVAAFVTEISLSVQVYTDGACLGNPGPGGWAYAVQGGPWASGAEAGTTNQRMEITAAWRAVERVEGPLEVVSDSTYVVNCFRQRWWKGWHDRGWLNTRKEPVANRDLWEPFIDLVLDRGDVSFTWVKGHSGDPMNDAVDALATEAARRQGARSGDRFGDDVVAGLDADRPGAAPDRSAPAQGAGGSGTVPADARHGIVIAGHRPPELGGYGDNAVVGEVRRRLVEILTAKRELEPDAVVYTGLGLGAEQLGAVAAAESGIPYVAVLPFPDPDARWPGASRREFRRLRDGAEAVVTVSDEAPRSRTEAGKALGRRDEWLARHGDEAIIVWDRSDGALSRLFGVLERAFGEDVWILEPPRA